jgi:Deoxyribonuclease II
MAQTLPAPTPLAGPNQPVDWLFAFKFNTASFEGCNDDGKIPVEGTPGIFGGTVQAYPNGHSQQYVFATSANPSLVKGPECLGGTLKDPLGATFGQVYNTPGYFYVLWNDQFYGDPMDSDESPWGHSKGMLAWNADGEGFVMQVSTPSWPASGSKENPRKTDGNTLGCIKDDDIEVSQHFFALKINRSDLVTILNALILAKVVTDPSLPQIVQNGGPADVQALVKKLGSPVSSKASCTVATLSSGVKVISKPAAVASPPWQVVSALLGGLPLRVASWWSKPKIYSTNAQSNISCWPLGIGKPGPVEIATDGSWNGTAFGLTGGSGKNFNHAKIGISTDSSKSISIFGDMNQQGALTPAYSYAKQTCQSSQNGRGGLFYVVDDPMLWKSLTELLKGGTAPTAAPPKNR